MVNQATNQPPNRPTEEPGLSYTPVDLNVLSEKIGRDLERRNLETEVMTEAMLNNFAEAFEGYLETNGLNIDQLHSLARSQNPEDQAQLTALLFSETGLLHKMEQENWGEKFFNENIMNSSWANLAQDPEGLALDNWSGNAATASLVGFMVWWGGKDKMTENAGKRFAKGFTIGAILSNPLAQQALGGTVRSGFKLTQATIHGSVEFLDNPLKFMEGETDRSAFASENLSNIRSQVELFPEQIQDVSNPDNVIPLKNIWEKVLIAQKSENVEFEKSEIEQSATFVFQSLKEAMSMEEYMQFVIDIKTENEKGLTTQNISRYLMTNASSGLVSYFTEQAPEDQKQVFLDKIKQLSQQPNPDFMTQSQVINQFKSTLPDNFNQLDKPGKMEILGTLNLGGSGIIMLVGLSAAVLGLFSATCVKPLMDKVTGKNKTENPKETKNPDTIKDKDREAVLKILEKNGSQSDCNQLVARLKNLGILSEAIPNNALKPPGFKALKANGDFKNDLTSGRSNTRTTFLKHAQLENNIKSNEEGFWNMRHSIKEAFDTITNKKGQTLALSIVSSAKEGNPQTIKLAEFKPVTKDFEAFTKDNTFKFKAKIDDTTHTFTLKHNPQDQKLWELTGGNQTYHNITGLNII